MIRRLAVALIVTLAAVAVPASSFAQAGALPTMPCGGTLQPPCV